MGVKGGKRITDIGRSEKLGTAQYFNLLYDWRESGLLLGLICLHKSLCLPGNWPKPVHKLILHENQLELVSRS